MKLIQTLYLQPSKNPFKDSFGWISPMYHLMGWTLSCLQLKKIYPKVEIYTNSSAAKLLIDTLELPYDKVNVTHDDLHLANENLWALPKIFTYSLQDTPFLHVDGDVFIFREFPIDLLNGMLIAQNLEEATEYYFSSQKELMKHFKYFPECVKNDFYAPQPIQAVNAGILGGNDLSFIHEYTNNAFEYIEQNRDCFSLINVDSFNVFFEQHLFLSLAKEKNIPIQFLISETIKDNEYEHLGDFYKTPNLKYYLHLLGEYKRDRYTCIQMASKLRDLYPSYYYKILSICREHKVPIDIDFPYDEKLISEKHYHDIHNKSKKTYLDGIEKSVEINSPKVTNRVINNLAMLQNLLAWYGESYSSFDKQKAEIDFQKFIKDIEETIDNKQQFSFDYLYGRDLDAVNWYCSLFAEESTLPDKIIVSCKEIDIIESEFDWAGLLNKGTKVGVKYYAGLELSDGRFFNLFIPEITKNEFSLFDIDEMDKIILERLSQPVSIKQLFSEMQSYVEEDVIQHHLMEYYEFLLTLIKQLVVKKAIKPA